MKAAVLFLILILILSVSNVTKADGFLLTIYYLQGEHSKDSHSTETSISIAGNDAVYSVKHSGFHAGKNENKTCTISDEELAKIQNWITKYGLNKTDSLFDETTKYKSYEVFTNISILVKLQESPYSTKINGDVDNLKDNMLYKNALRFITRVTAILEKC